METLFRFRESLLKYRYQLFILIVLAFTSTVLEGFGIGLFFPLLEYIQKGKTAFSNGRFKQLFDFMESVGITASLENMLIIIFTVISMTYTVTLIMQLLNVYTYCKLNQNLRDDAFKKIINLPMDYFTSISSGKLVNIIQVEVEHVGLALSALITFITDFGFLLVYMSFAFYISLELSLIVFFVALLRFKFVAIFVDWIHVLGERKGKLNAEYSSYLVGAYQGMDVIKTYSTENQELDRMKKMSWEWMDNMIRQQKIGFSSVYFENILTVLLLCLLIFAGIEVLVIDSTSILVFLYIMSRIGPRITKTNESRVRFASLISQIVFLKEIFGEGSRQPRKWGSGKKRDFNECIEFKSVYFSYDNTEKYALEDITFQIFKNETVAIVGESGAGKTTFVRLLLNLYPPTMGAIYIDGDRYQEIDRDSWKNLISVVSQDTFVFDDSIKNNIKYSVENCSDEEFWNAVTMARADGFIQEFPQREETLIGERGVKLSGGQRQRIAIARAFLRNSPILVLDEATSALDSITESMIQQALEDLAVNRTMVIIAHRLSTIKNADRILVLDKGRIAEIGTHSQLLENDQLYKKYHLLQIR